MSNEKFRRDLQKRAAARAKQTQTAEPVKSTPKKIPVWQGCLMIILVILTVGGILAGVVYKVQIEPAVQTLDVTMQGFVPTIEAERVIGRLSAACFGYTNLTSTRCDEKALAAWQKDEATVRVCVGAYEDLTSGGKYMLDCIVKRGLWDS